MAPVTEIGNKKNRSKSNKAGITFPVSRVVKKLKSGNYTKKVRVASGIYLAAVLEYLCAEILELAGHITKTNKKIRITPRLLSLAIKEDQEFNELLTNVIISQGGVLPYVHKTLLPPKKNKIRSDGVLSQEY